MEVKLVDLNGPDAPRLVTESLIQSGFAVLTNHAISKKEITKKIIPIFQLHAT